MTEENSITKGNNESTNKSISSNNDKTFIKLQELQTLLKKESALKELCKKSLEII